MGAERRLVLVRHAKSDWSRDEPDFERPLASRGRRQAPEAGRWLAEHVGAIDLAVVSSAVRTRETWDLVSEQLAERPPTRYEDRAYAASGQVLLGLVRELREDVRTVAFVGHNPGLEDLVATLTGRQVTMPTSALAVIGVEGAWATAGAHAAPLLAAGRPPTGAPS